MKGLTKYKSFLILIYHIGWDSCTSQHIWPGINVSSEFLIIVLRKKNRHRKWVVLHFSIHCCNCCIFFWFSKCVRLKRIVEYFFAWEWLFCTWSGMILKTKILNPLINAQLWHSTTHNRGYCVYPENDQFMF